MFKNRTDSEFKLFVLINIILYSFQMRTFRYLADPVCDKVQKQKRYNFFEFKEIMDQSLVSFKFKF